MARKSKEDAEKTRQAVMESALDVFSEKGYAKATFDEIAARAGFTKGAVYWYFRNKADLVAALIIEYMGRKYQELRPEMSEENNLDSLLNYFLLWCRASAKDLRFARFSRFVVCQMEWSEGVIDRVGKVLDTAKHYHAERINQVLVAAKARGELKDDLDLELVKHIILSTYTGIVFSSLSRSHNMKVEDMVGMGLKLLFDGIRK